MQALSSFNSSEHPDISAALHGLEDPAHGFSASSYFSERGAFARFVWPDWPAPLRDDLTARVNEFHQAHPEVHPVPERSREWQAVFRDWSTDMESADVIARAFVRQFGKERVAWVESEKDSRGRIGASCMIKDLLHVPMVRSDSAISKITQQSVGRRAEMAPCSLQLSWRDSTALPPGPLSDADHEAFEAAAREVFNWASSRIQPTLDALHDKLSALYGDRFRGLYVFGSYARPDAGIKLPEDSDLDVALLLSDMTNAYDEIKRFGGITSDLTSQYGLVVSVIPIREADFREGRTNFTRVISEYAVPWNGQGDRGASQESAGEVEGRRDASPASPGRG